ncbi:hypothetical protein V6N13_070116 [Hibiscus sabdariffa]
MFLFFGNGWILMALFEGIRELGLRFFSQRFDLSEVNREEVEAKEETWNKISSNNNNEKDTFLEKSEEIRKGIKTLIKLWSGRGEIIQINGVNSSNFLLEDLDKTLKGLLEKTKIEGKIVREFCSLRLGIEKGNQNLQEQ